MVLTVAIGSSSFIRVAANAASTFPSLVKAALSLSSEPAPAPAALRFGTGYIDKGGETAIGFRTFTGTGWEIFALKAHGIWTCPPIRSISA